MFRTPDSNPDSEGGRHPADFAAASDRLGDSDGFAGRRGRPRQAKHWHRPCDFRFHILSDHRITPIWNMTVSLIGPNNEFIYMNLNS